MFICRTIRPTFKRDDREWWHLNFIHFAGNESSLLSICQDTWWLGYAGQSDHMAEDTFVHTFPVNRALLCYIWWCVVRVNKPCFQCVRYLRPASSCRSCSLCEVAGVWSSRIPTWWLLPLQRWCRCLEKRHNRDRKVSRARVAAAGMYKKHATWWIFQSYSMNNDTLKEERVKFWWVWTEYGKLVCADCC